jgi:hypothetical protein
VTESLVLLGVVIGLAGFTAVDEAPGVADFTPFAGFAAILGVGVRGFAVVDETADVAGFVVDEFVAGGFAAVDEEATGVTGFAPTATAGFAPAGGTSVFAPTTGVVGLTTAGGAIGLTATGAAGFATTGAFFARGFIVKTTKKLWLKKTTTDNNQIILPDWRFVINFILYSPPCTTH